MTPLPRLMVAPTGARRGKADHPALPVSIPEIVATAVACFAAGARAIHAHVRDAGGLHSLDPGLYRELLAELHRRGVFMTDGRRARDNAERIAEGAALIAGIG